MYCHSGVKSWHWPRSRTSLAGLDPAQFFIKDEWGAGRFDKLISGTYADPQTMWSCWREIQAMEKNGVQKKRSNISPQVGIGALETLWGSM